MRENRKRDDRAADGTPKDIHLSPREQDLLNLMRANPNATPSVLAFELGTSIGAICSLQYSIVKKLRIQKERQRWKSIKKNMTV